MGTIFFIAPGDCLVECGQTVAQEDAMYRCLVDDIWGFEMLRLLKVFS